jgi:hypothetical protein
MFCFRCEEFRHNRFVPFRVITGAAATLYTFLTVCWAACTHFNGWSDLQYLDTVVAVIGIVSEWDTVGAA